ncbi:hypothetical protein LTSEADE_0299 [Salmonella enterica subsp. enterica serovar Adelaide str. A4-669]|uniref:Uncharacterized protein n=1 Tax=Salmonella enterica subsp. enterica serovar Adelaide str. A4-669 TaxID=913063 RepID=A0A6C8GTN2_SALET|nr:hypothetical protein LTSEADE_0299 [Salmonella enterica subsp. enterica serovar Adelaide str. A4-669]
MPVQRRAKQGCYVASPENNVASVGSRKRLIGITITGK